VELVLWRDTEGTVHAWEDFCVHRGVRLSLGHVTDDTVVCAYHAWNYDGTGRCTLIPAEEHRAIEDRVLAQDIAIVNSQRPEWLQQGA
jgi:phenylpropionate dioxygenase-like ring-hydroxylating dioxygenase large terminal subunit